MKWRLLFTLIFLFSPILSQARGPIDNFALSLAKIFDQKIGCYPINSEDLLIEEYQALIENEEYCDAAQVAYFNFVRGGSHHISMAINSLEALYLAKDYAQLSALALRIEDLLIDTGEPVSDVVRSHALRGVYQIIIDLGPERHTEALRLALGNHPSQRGIGIGLGRLSFDSFHLDFEKSVLSKEMKSLHQKVIQVHVLRELNIAEQYNKKHRFIAALRRTQALLSYPSLFTLPKEEYIHVIERTIVFANRVAMALRGEKFVLEELSWFTQALAKKYRSTSEDLRSIRYSARSFAIEFPQLFSEGDSWKEMSHVFEKIADTLSKNLAQIN